MSCRYSVWLNEPGLLKGMALLIKLYKSCAVLKRVKVPVPIKAGIVLGRMKPFW